MSRKVEVKRIFDKAIRTNQGRGITNWFYSTMDDQFLSYLHWDTEKMNRGELRDSLSMFRRQTNGAKLIREQHRRHQELKEQRAK